jgi:hypothetical protein
VTILFLNIDREQEVNMFIQSYTFECFSMLHCPEDCNENQNTMKPHLRLYWGSVGFNTDLRKILYGGNLNTVIIELESLNKGKS